MTLASRLKYAVRKFGMELRDMALGPRYRIEGQKLFLPRGGDPWIKSAVMGDRYEHDEREMIKAFLPPDLPVIELGGSYGIVSFTIRRCLMTNQRLVVVEANPTIIPVCLTNVSLAGSVSQTNVVHAALAYGGAKVRFKISENVHTSHLVFDNSTGPDIVEVPSTTVQDMRDAYGISGPYCLVCDIEGAELLMLRNEDAPLRDCRVMIMETHPDVYPDSGGSLEEVENLLSKMGFVIFNKRSNVIAARRG